MFAIMDENADSTLDMKELINGLFKIYFSSFDTKGLHLELVAVDDRDRVALLVRDEDLARLWRRRQAGRPEKRQGQASVHHLSLVQLRRQRLSGSSNPRVSSGVR